MHLENLCHSSWWQEMRERRLQGCEGIKRWCVFGQHKRKSWMWFCALRLWHGLSALALCLIVNAYFSLTKVTDCGNSWELSFSAASCYFWVTATDFWMENLKTDMVKLHWNSFQSQQSRSFFFLNKCFLVKSADQTEDQKHHRLYVKSWTNLLWCHEVWFFSFFWSSGRRWMDHARHLC